MIGNGTDPRLLCMFLPQSHDVALICSTSFAHPQRSRLHPHRTQPVPERLCQRGTSSGHVIVRCKIVLEYLLVKKSGTHYFAMILPGSATLKVHSRPLPGLKTAVGFDVSTVIPFGVPLAS